MSNHIGGVAEVYDAMGERTPSKDTPMTTKESEVDVRVMDDAEVVRVARALCKHTADTCNTDAEDEWTIYSNDFKQMAAVAITALRNARVKV